MTSLSKWEASFKAEAADCLHHLESGILVLEKKILDPALLTSLFRIAHTLKGSSRLAGFPDIQTHANALEQIFSDTLNTKTTFDAHTATTCLSKLDSIRAILEKTSLLPIQNVRIEEEKRGSRSVTIESNLQHPHEVLASETLNIPLSRIDALMTVIEELSLKNPSSDPVLEELKYQAKDLRLVPLSHLFEEAERVVRDIALAEHKQVDLRTEGASVEIDKKIVDILRPCLMHLLRNAVSHGIESSKTRQAKGKVPKGSIVLKAVYQERRIFLEIQDDGAGMNINQIRQELLRQNTLSQEELQGLSDQDVLSAIFRPGFSTKQNVNAISGRGVGLDVVKTEVEKANGQIRVESTPGSGTRFILHLPVSLLLSHITVVEAEGQKFGFFISDLQEMRSVSVSRIHSVEGQWGITLHDRYIPVVSLSRILKLPSRKEKDSQSLSYFTIDQKVLIAVGVYNEDRMGFMVDRALWDEDVIMKPAPVFEGYSPLTRGVAMLSSGDLAIIVNVPILFSQFYTKPVSDNPLPISSTPKRILIVEDSKVSREIEKDILMSHGYDIEIAKDGMEALSLLESGQWDGIISDIEMPLLTGVELCEIVKSREGLRHIPFIFLSSLNSEEQKQEGLRVGAAAYLDKQSFNQNEFLETVIRVIG